LLSPPSSQIPADRVGDLGVPQALVKATPGAVAETLQMFFEGGNLLFTNQRILVGRNLVEAEMQRSSHSELDVLATLQSTFGREPLVLGVDAAMPHEHLDMYLTVIDDHTVLLADPKRGADYIGEVTRLGLDAALLPGANRWTAQAQLRLRSIYETLASQLRHHGFTVHRLPVVHGDETVMLTWNNALIESRQGQRHAYVPVYGLPILDQEAIATYQRLGCRVWPIDVSRIAIHGGTVRCVTNVLAWSTAPHPPRK
jgi:N-dimethylarginine dimethylaminohydrolase